MKYFWRTVLVALMAALLAGCTAHAPVQKSEPSRDLPYDPPAGLMVVDGLIVRPLLLVPCAASTGVYIALSPVLYIMGIGEPMARAMVETPWRFTVARPLGDFTGSTKDGRPIHIGAEW